MTTAAQAAAVVGAGLAALLRRAGARCASPGSARWALGLAVLASTSRRPEHRAARRRRGRRPRRRVRPAPGRSTRWPYLLAFATLACLPVRIPVDDRRRRRPTCSCRSTRSWRRSRSRSPGSSCAATPARASSVRSPGRSPPSSPGRALSLLWTGDVRRRARSSLARLRAAVRAARDRLRAAAVARPLADVAAGAASSRRRSRTRRSASTSGRRVTSSGTRR